MRIVLLVLLAVLFFQIGRTIWLGYQEQQLLSDQFPSPDIPSCEITGYHLNWDGTRFYCENGKR